MSTSSRRTFIKAGLAASGALVLGYFSQSCVSTNAQRRQMALYAQKTGELAPNAWITILPTGQVSFTLDRVEMGQGTMTSHAMMVAEELEVDPASIQILLADADRRYDHNNFKLQITGGSTSVVSSWEPLRVAAASTRELLRLAAAALWEIDPEGCTVREGKVYGPKPGQVFGYGELTKTAALLPIPDVEPKPPSQWKVLGRSVPRLDARAKIDGTATFGIDVEVPNMVHAYVIRPPVITGQAASFDATLALKALGVIDVFAIERGVVVVAKRYWQALRAAPLVKIEWQSGRLAGANSASLLKQLYTKAKTPGDEIRDDGDLDQAMRTQGAQLLDAYYEVPYLAHATLEPQNCTASFTADGCEVWAPTQGPGLAQEFVALATGLEREQVKVHNTLLGGGFGRRLAQDYAVEAALISKRIQRPVKVIWSRADDTHYDYFRPLGVSHMRGAVSAKGEPLAWSHRLVTQTILGQTDWLTSIMPDWIPKTTRVMLSKSSMSLMQDGTLPDATTTEGADSMPYAIPNVRVELHLQKPIMPVGFWRSVGHSGNAFVVESFIDELAAAAKQDPYQWRRALLKDHPKQRRVLDAVAKTAQWGQRPEGIWQGIAQHSSFNGHCAHVVELVKDGEDLLIHRVVSAIDCGRPLNPDIIQAQIEGAIIFGLSAALKQQITLKDGRIEQTNFHNYPLLRMFEAPQIEVHIIPSEEDPVGVGETGLPPIAPALGNAIFAATGKRLRRLPFALDLDLDASPLRATRSPR